jgi:hypothetical protein
MKLPALLVALALAAVSAFAADPPKIAIDQALKLAMDHLAERGLTGQHYISALTLEDSTLSGGEKYWFARWTPAIRSEQKNESGLRINMDGSLARLTSGGPAAARADAPGRRSIGSRNIR